MKTSTTFMPGIGLAIAGSLALGLGFASPATADSTSQTSSSTALSYTYQQVAEEGSGYPLYVKTGARNNGLSKRTVAPNLFEFSADDDTMVNAYCIELDVSAIRGASGTLKSWSKYEGAEQSRLRGNEELQNKINWIVANSYPKVDVDALASSAGVAELTQKEAITATQAAIWSLANGVEFDFSQTGGDSAKAAGAQDRIETLFAYLTGTENTGLRFTAGLENASLKLTATAFDKTDQPEVRATEAGFEIGSLAVDLQAISSVTLHAAAVDGTEFTLVDEDDQVVDLEGGLEVEDGDVLTVVVDGVDDGQPIEDTIVFTTDTVENTSVTGGVVEPMKDGKRSQAILLIDEEEETLSTTAELRFSIIPESETPEQPETPDESETPVEPETPEEPETPVADEEEPEIVEAEMTDEGITITLSAEEGQPEPEVQAAAQEQGDSLARTGAEHIWALAAVGFVLIGGGIALFMVRRRAA